MLSTQQGLAGIAYGAQEARLGHDWLQRLRGLQLDGEDHWQGLRVVTPEVDVLYDEESCYSVIVKDNVMSIGERAFSFCTGLTSVTFPEGLTSIGEKAFIGAKGSPR